MKINERFNRIKRDLVDIHNFYDKIDGTSTRMLNEIMPCLGDIFPDGKTEGLKTVNRSLGNKLFEGLTQLEKVVHENNGYKVKVKSFAIAWEELPFYDKSKVLIWINDSIELWKPADSGILEAKEKLEAGISEINGYLVKISIISDKLLEEILPKPGDCWKIKDKPTDEVVSLCLDDSDHLEQVVGICRSKEGDDFFIETTVRNINWTELPHLEKSFLLSQINKLCLDPDGEKS